MSFVKRRNRKSDDIILAKCLVEAGTLNSNLSRKTVQILFHAMLFLLVIVIYQMGKVWR